MTDINSIMLLYFGFSFLCFLCTFAIPFFLLKAYLHLKRSSWKKKQNISLSVGFFHPFCNAGGGGERVLWCAIRAVQKRYSQVHCVIYTGDKVPGSAILEKAEKSFKIKLLKPVDFVYLKHRNFVEAKNYPYFTLLLQSLASVILGLEAAFKHVPDVYLDTMGYAWTYPIFRYLCSCRVGAYVHYPTISTDMLSSVSQQKVTLNNREFISKSHILSCLKVFYYQLFAVLYSFMGRKAEIIMVNSTWTRNHILELWKKPEFTFIVYPPCDVAQFEILPLKSRINMEKLRIISIAQFRPEKDHKLQLNALKEFLERVPVARRSVALVLIGSCRHEEDYGRVEKLKKLCKELGIENNVEFKINVTFDEILQEMEDADISLHTMWNEHFGIGIVECMSAGLIMIAHDSGGPKLDIITSGKTGFLASEVTDYADALESIWDMDSSELIEMRKNARESVVRFSSARFEESFLSAIHLLFQS